MALVQTIASVLVAWVLWRLLKKLTAPKPFVLDVAGPQSEHWLKGNYHRLFQDGLDYNLQLSEKYGGAIKIHALLGQEQLYVSDPRAMYHIVVKEQDVYEETDMFIMGNQLIFGPGLISTLGEQHRKQRKMLNPVFSLANMRDLLPIIQPIADKLCGVLQSQATEISGTQEVDVIPWTSRAALEYICQAGLGYTFNALDPQKTTDYIDALRRFSPTALRLLLVRPFIPIVMRSFSLYWRNKIMDWAPLKPLQDLRRIVEIMDRTSRQIYMEKRSKLGQPANLDLDAPKPLEGDLGSHMQGRDIMSIMLKANSSSDEGDMLTESELVGQINTIIFAGFETTAMATSRLLYILSNKPEVQARLRNEIRKAKRAYASSIGEDESNWASLNLPYDVLMNIPYLDAIIRETLRVHPPTSLLGRTVRKATVLPLQFPVRNRAGEEITSIPLAENTNIIISLLNSNHNKSIWGEDASEWRPERWLTASGERIRIGGDVDDNLWETDRSAGADGAGVEVPGTRGGVKYPGVYASMMTFLGGGRACIGFKFAEMEMKQVLTTLLSSLHFSLPADKEIYWKINGLQVPVVRPPAGDNVTPRVPLAIRKVQEGDFAA